MPTWENDYNLWIQQRIDYLKFNINILYLLFTPINSKIISFLYLFGFIFSFFSRKENYSLWIYFVVSLVWCISNVICISLTPYGSYPRYYVISCFVIVGGGAFFIATVIQKLISLKFSEIISQKNVKPLEVMLDILICLILFFMSIYFSSKELFYNKNDYYLSWTKNIENIAIKKNELVAVKSPQPEIISFYTGWHTIYLPENINEFDRNYQAWLRRWKPTYLLIDLYDFNNPLAAYPHATVSTILDPVVLLKININEASLTKQDIYDNAETRDLWKQKIYANIPVADNFFLDDSFYAKGVARTGGGFFVQNTPENQLNFSVGRIVLLPNGERRLITEVTSTGNHWYVKVMGESFANQFSDLPDSFKTIDGVSQP